MFINLIGVQGALVFLMTLWLLEDQATKPRCFVQSIQLRIENFKSKTQSFVQQISSLTNLLKFCVHYITSKIQITMLCLQKEILFLQFSFASSSRNSSTSPWFLRFSTSLAIQPSRSWNKKRKVSKHVKIQELIAKTSLNTHH